MGRGKQLVHCGMHAYMLPLAPLREPNHTNAGLQGGLSETVWLELGHFPQAGHCPCDGISGARLRHTWS